MFLLFYGLQLRIGMNKYEKVFILCEHVCVQSSVLHLSAIEEDTTILLEASGSMLLAKSVQSRP